MSNKGLHIVLIYTLFFYISHWLISNSTEILPKIKQLKNAQFDYPSNFDEQYCSFCF